MSPMTWGTHHTFKPMKIEQAEKMFRKMKSVIDQRLIWFGFYKKTPICFFIGIPDPNQYLKFVNGNLNIFGKMKFLYHKTFTQANVVSAMVFGVTPKFQKLYTEISNNGTLKFQKWYTEISENGIQDFQNKGKI